MSLSEHAYFCAASRKSQPVLSASDSLETQHTMVLHGHRKQQSNSLVYAHQLSSLVSLDMSLPFHSSDQCLPQPPHWTSAFKTQVCQFWKRHLGSAWTPLNLQEPCTPHKTRSNQDWRYSLQGNNSKGQRKSTYDSVEFCPQVRPCIKLAHEAIQSSRTIWLDLAF